MKQNGNKLTKMMGWILLLVALGFFCFQIGYFFLHARFQVEYIDNRFFYVINIFWVICIALALLLLLKITKTWQMIGACMMFIFLIVNGVLLVVSNNEIKNIVSVSPDFKHVLSIKANTKSGEAVYYRSYYNILARPKEKLPYATDGEFNVEWLAKDVGAVTYKTADNSIQQFIGTYGDRGSGSSYYYVGPEIHGSWEGDNTQVVSNTEGISVTENGKIELFDWDHIVQFGTLAIVLVRDSEAAWTISLDENFEVHSDASAIQTGDISLYEASMEENKPITLHYVPSN